MAINAVITIMNPPLIILGGGMISEIQEFSDMVISYARRNAWAGSWNETTIHVAGPGLDAQIAGAAHLLVKVMAGEM
jgi:predicted NBD/HSP70 family sugar kinase